MIKKSQQLPLFVQKSTSRTPTMHIYCDGAARGNPGPAGIGIVITRNETTIFKGGFAIGEKTNNQAEYLAFIVALLAAKEYVTDTDFISVHSDSELLVQQMNGSYRVRNPDLQKLFKVAYVLSTQLPIGINHVKREANKLADALANHGVDTNSPVPNNYKQVLHEYQLNI